MTTTSDAKRALPAGHTAQPQQAGGVPPATPAHPATPAPAQAPRPGDDPLQRWLVAFTLALVAALRAATLARCGGSPTDEAEPRAAIPQAPSASQAI